MKQETRIGFWWESLLKEYVRGWT